MSHESREERYRKVLEKARNELGEEYFNRFRSDLHGMLGGLSPASLTALMDDPDPPIRLANPREPDPGSDDDARWFAANPGRSHRLRPMVEGEPRLLGVTTAPAPGTTEMVIVRRVETGMRARLPVGAMSFTPPDDSIDDRFLEVMFDAYLEAWCQARPVDHDELIIRMWQAFSAGLAHRA
jgi:hypothetical protein